MKKNAVVNLLKNITLSIVSLIFFLGTAEILCRLKYSPEKIRYESLYEYDKEKVYRLKKNFYGQIVFKRKTDHGGQTVEHVTTTEVITNSFGQRDSEISIEKPLDTIRILALGDSVTFGDGVNGEETYPELLERRLNNAIPDRCFEVINAATPRNSAFQEYYDLARGMQFSPDMVILQFTLNDITEPYQVYRRYGGSGKFFHDVEDIPYSHYFLIQHSAFYLF